MTCKQFFLSCNRPLPCNATRYIDGILAVKLKAVHVHYITVFTIGVILHVLLFLHKEMTLNLQKHHTKYELRKYYFTNKVIIMQCATAAVFTSAGDLFY